MSFNSYGYFVLHFEKKHINIWNKKILRHECFHFVDNYQLRGVGILMVRHLTLNLTLITLTSIDEYL